MNSEAWAWGYYLGLWVVLCLGGGLIVERHDLEGMLVLVTSAAGVAILEETAGS